MTWDHCFFISSQVYVGQYSLTYEAVTPFAPEVQQTKHVFSQQFSNRMTTFSPYARPRQYREAA